MRKFKSKFRFLTILVLPAMIFISCNRQAPKQPGKQVTGKTLSQIEAFYKNYGMELPADILTPDQVNSTIGRLDYDDGRPLDKTVQKAYHYLDRYRAVDVFLTNLSAVASAVLQPAFAKMGATESYDVLISEQLIDAHQVWPTGNTGTVYLFAYLDLKKDGPIVIEIPGGIGPGFMDDAWMRWVIDMGPTGPDRGKGGTYVFLPPDYKGKINAPIGGARARMSIGGKIRDVFVVKSKTYHNWMASVSYTHLTLPTKA